mmetsp:Transcript_10522/g.21649  ORF Transcript_10522/g.21649 Transcript_10522/m.21649 type:complete len:488 (-) Transcript_10522:107-1570(-)|eukprot:CAMPEP_0172465472 /NCGR_PEP_ID=MMETSP1065-20121228/53604_1 /TAXON_ID=265537 /ORGANISM="Amphiprora paludosa, Strain CCMP125" /LENGTH=487 /DNA_ID=CAMNT_0013222003 /DNA_START=92 /DNA_END=1555 /DNA_ORIENTATION=-
MKISTQASLLLLALVALPSHAFTVSSGPQARSGPTERLLALQVSSTADDFAAFETSLEEDNDDTTTTNQADSTKESTDEKNTAWQAKLERLLDPTTPASKRQNLLSDLVSANADIRSSVESAIRGRSIDPLLTPTGKRLQEGSRAVARQLTSDILPELVQQGNKQRASSPLPFPPVPPLPNVSNEDINKVGTRIFNALQNRFQTDIEAMQSDIQNDPLRSIPQRITKQSRAVLKEAGNVFAETPAGLKEPSYAVVAETSDYEIRDYEGYQVASTNVVAGVEVSGNPSLAENGAAFNTLTAYFFGANKDGVAMEMTTPVTTTSTGEMRFYLDKEDNNGIIPDPLEQDESSNIFERPGSILIQDIPAARLAVRRFSGFATKGEVARQKEALLASLAMDDVELDVPHGATVPHVVFQYNPPYTLPVLRRNEIAVAVSTTSAGVAAASSTPNGVASSVGKPAAAASGSDSTNGDEEGGLADSIRDNWEPVE